MYKTINQVLELTTLSKPQVDRNYYKLPKEYKEQQLIRLNKGIREVHETIVSELITRKRKREFTEKDIQALLYNDWDYFGTVRPYGKQSVEYCKAIIGIMFMHLVEKHGATKVKLIYFVEDPQNQTHVHYLLQVEGLTNIKQITENHLRLISECNTHLVKYDVEQGDRCKSYITKEQNENEGCWGYLEN